MHGNSTILIMACRFVAEKSAAAVTSFVGQVAMQTLAATDSASPAVAPLLLLAACARAALPAVLASVPELVKHRSRLVAPAAVRKTLWLLAQVADGGERGRASALHIWCRLVLPAMVLAPVDIAEGKAAEKKKSCKADSICHLEAAALEPAAAFAHSLLAAGVRGAARNGVPAGAAAASVPAVPASAVAAVEAAARGSEMRPVPRAVALQAASLQGPLADIRAECGTADAVRDAIAMAFDVAAAGDEAAGADAAVEQLRRHRDVAARAWAKAHRAAISPSTALLEYLVRRRAALAPLLGTADGPATLATLLAGLTKANAPLLRSNNSGAAARIAKRAQAAVESLQLASVTDGRTSGVVSLMAMTVLAAGALVYTAQHPAYVQEALSAYVGGGLAGGLVVACETISAAAGTAVSHVWASLTGKQ
jgi:hypothetical protein